MKKLLKIFFIFIAAVLFIFFVCKCERWLSTDAYILEVFFSAFGSVYAIIVGFVILVALNNYIDIKKYVSSEINALQDLRDYLMYLDNNEEVVKEIKEKIKIYTESIINKEWKDMLSAKHTNTDTSEELYDLMKSVNKIKPTNQSDIVALDKLIDTIGFITTYRTDRLNSSAEKLPPILKHLVIFLSLALIFCFSLMPIDKMIIKAILNSINVFSIMFIYIVIIDLNNPFKGTWSITYKPFEDFLKKL